MFTTGDWNRLQTGRAGGPGLESIDVPREFWKLPGAPRELGADDPLVVDAIRNDRPCRPGFEEGCRVQVVLDAAMRSAESRTWTEVDEMQEASR